jgi:hypothetical protein
LDRIIRAKLSGETSKDILHKTDGVVDIDWTVEANQTEYKLVVEKKKSNAEQVPQQIVGNLTYLLKEYPISNLYDENSVTM